MSKSNCSPACCRLWWFWRESALSLFLTYLSPGDPVENMYISMGQMPSEEIVEQTREEMGLNDPFLTQYIRWLGNCLHGDFGTSYSLHQPVTELLLERVGPTLRLTAMALIMMLLLSVPLGVVSALYKDSWVDYLARGVTFLGCAMPNFWVALLLMLAFCVRFPIFPVISAQGDFKSLFLPALTLAIAMASKYTRQVRAAVLEELNQDYVIGAQARASEKQDHLGKCVPQCVAAPCDHAWSVSGKPFGRNFGGGDHLFLSGSW